MSLGSIVPGVDKGMFYILCISTRHNGSMIRFSPHVVS